MRKKLVESEPNRNDDDNGDSFSQKDSLTAVVACDREDGDLGENDEDDDGGVLAWLLPVGALGEELD